MPQGPASRRLILTLICLLVTGTLVFLYEKNLQYESLERAARDWLLTNGRARRAFRDPRLVFLAIDEASRQLDTVFAEDFQKSPALRLMKNGYPYPREFYAHLIDRLADAGAKAIVFDIIFPSPKEGDEAFHAALERHKDRVVIGSTLVTKGQEDVGSSVYSGTLQTVPPATTLIPNNPSDHRVGFVNVHPDPDGIVRQVIYRTTQLEFFRSAEGGHELLSLAGSALQQAGLKDHIPSERGPVMPRYAEDFEPRSLYEIFVESMWSAPPYRGGEFFRGKIILIGALGQSSEDRVQTPFGVTVGPYIHLNAINAALHRDFLTVPSAQADVALLAGGGALAWLLGAFIRRPLLRLLLLAAVAAAYVQTAQWVANEGLQLILIGPLLVLSVSGIIFSAWEQVIDRMERQRTRKALDRYVGRDVASEVLDNPASYLNTLTGERKQIAIIFSDIRGFTTRTETADPHALVRQLNEYFEAMVAIVYANRGTLDKFIGDAVMAHWGSIVSEGPAIDAAGAVNAVLEMQARTRELNETWQKQGVQTIQVGFGVNQGDAIVGNLGCEAKMEVSAIGDAVNLGSRLEGATKQYHLDICLGENVAKLVRDQFVLRSVDLIIVKGKTQPVEIFTVLGKRSETEPSWLATHEEAMRHYRAGDFGGAEKAWREVLAQIPGDGLTEVMLGRCTELQIHPPAKPWTGVYEMKSK
jgi:adenylate cyclase